MPSGSLPLPPALPKWMTRSPKSQPNRGLALAGAVGALVVTLVARSFR
jgi:hypothetical protein